MVVKNSMARRATEGTPLAAAFESMEGSLAVVWGGEDIVSLAKEIVRFAGEKQFAPFAAARGRDGRRPLTADQVRQVSKWPTREEQLSILMGQILSPGATLVSQLTSAGAALASQIKQKSEEDARKRGRSQQPPQLARHYGPSCNRRQQRNISSVQPKTCDRRNPDVGPPARKVRKDRK